MCFLYIWIDLEYINYWDLLYRGCFKLAGVRLAVFLRDGLKSRSQVCRGTRGDFESILEPGELGTYFDMSAVSHNATYNPECVASLETQACLRHGTTFNRGTGDVLEKGFWEPGFGLDTVHHLSPIPRIILIRAFAQNLKHISRW